MQAHPGMGVVHDLDLPGISLANGHANFFVQFTAQGLFHRFTGLELAARKLPIAGVHLAFWA